MKIFKRNQIIILVMSFMLITAGYLNFKNNYNSENQTTSTILGELGDATLVSSNLIDDNVTSDEIVENKETNQINEEVTPDANIQAEEDIETVKQEEEKNSYFVNSKLERSNMYSETLETYQKIYNDTSSTAEQKELAIQQIAEINSQKNAIMIIENLIQTKGIKNIVIFVNGSSVSVVVEAEEIEPEKIAQMQNIISRELNVAIEDIHISTL